MTEQAHPTPEPEERWFTIEIANLRAALDSARSRVEALEGERDAALWRAENHYDWQGPAIQELQRQLQEARKGLDRIARAYDLPVDLRPSATGLVAWAAAALKASEPAQGGEGKG